MPVATRRLPYMLRIRTTRRTRRQWRELLRIFRTMYPGMGADDLMRRMMTNHRDYLERVCRRTGRDWGTTLEAARGLPDEPEPPPFTGPPPTVPRVLD
jgi:hypothetical protein